MHTTFTAAILRLFECHFDWLQKKLPKELGLNEKIQSWITYKVK